MNKRSVNIAIVGATGLVGSELLEAMAVRRFPVSSLRLFASMNTAGERIEFMDDEVKVELISADYFAGSDIVFFAAHPMVSRDLAESAAREGVIVIDSSRTFRMDPNAALVVPEVNPEALDEIQDGMGIVASPSAAAIALSLVAAPLHRRWGIKRLVAMTAYGSTSAGRAGFEEHQRQTIDFFSQNELKIEKFTRQTAFNLFPRVGAFNGDGETVAESELREELPRVLGDDIQVAATAMQAPFFCGICCAANIELAKKASVKSVRDELKKSPGVTLMDDPAKEVYPDTMAAMGKDEVLVGRIRNDPDRPRAIQLWVFADNLRKGSSLNMLQIAEYFIRGEK